MIRLVFPFLLFASCLQAETPTNFIQILTDDQGWGDLKSYGHVQMKKQLIAYDNDVLTNTTAGGRRAAGVETFQQKSSAKPR